MEFKTLNRPKGSNRYCGPAAISFLTGLDTSEAAALIRQHDQRRAIKGTSTSALIATLRDLGIKVNAQPEVKGLTLAGWLKASVAQRTEGRMFLVIAGYHFQLVSGRRYACGRIGEICSIRDKRVKRRSRVHAVFELSGTPQASERVRTVKAKARAVSDARRAERNATAHARRRVRELEAAGIIEIDASDFSTYLRHIYVYPGEKFAGVRDDGGDWPGDPYDGAHIVHDYREAAERGEFYAKHYAEHGGTFEPGK